MRREMGKADWNDMFQDNPDCTEIGFRNKRLTQRFLPGSGLGFDDRGFTTPADVVSGPKIKLFFIQMVRADLGERDIADLPLPVSIIATDIGTGERVVFRDGSLTRAMRASMSMPGLMTPVDHQGRRLVDGGLVDNLPIREVRECCNAEVAIAVNVGSPLLSPQSVTGLLSVSAQMVNILTEQNVSLSLATLKPGDIYIKSDLPGITAAGFSRNGETADRGRVAAEAQAEAQAEALARLSVPAAEYAKWRAHIEGKDRPRQRVDEIEITGLAVVNPKAVERRLRQQIGELLDTAALNRDLLRVYRDGHFQEVDYALMNLRQRNGLRIAPVEKPRGPDCVRMAVNLDSSLLLGSTFGLCVACQRTWINSLGGELLASAQIGSGQGIGVEWYQPVEARQQCFVQATTVLTRRSARVFLGDERVAEYRVGTGGAVVSGGVNLGLIGQARLGWRETRRSAKSEIGFSGLLPQIGAGTVNDGGVIAAIEFDQLNPLHFPSRGWDARLHHYDSSSQGYGRLALDLRGACPLGDYGLGWQLSQTLSTEGNLPFYDAAHLGGFPNLSAFANDQLAGDPASCLQLRAERIVGRRRPA